MRRLPVTVARVRGGRERKGFKCSVLKQRDPDASATRCRRFLLPGARRLGPLSTPPPFPALSSGAERRFGRRLRLTRRPLQPGGGGGGGTKPAALRGNPAGAGVRRGLLTGWPGAASGEPCPGREGEPRAGRGAQTRGRGVGVQRCEAGSRGPQSGPRFSRVSPGHPP